MHTNLLKAHVYSVVHCYGKQLNSIIWQLVNKFITFPRHTSIVAAFSLSTTKILVFTGDSATGPEDSLTQSIA